MRNNKELRDWRIVEEISLQIIKTMQEFKSNEHPKAKITNAHFTKALSSILNKRITKIK
jgi:hypothetical protein